MALPSMPSMPCICLLFSSSEDAISTPSLRTLLAPPWASILLGIRCFATMPHRAPQGFSMVLAGPSRQLWLCLLCLLCLAYAFCLAVPKMLFRQHLCARFWHRLGLQSCWGSGVSQPCPTVLHRAFPWYWPVHPDSYGFAFYAFYALHMPSVLLYLSSDLGVVCLFRRSCIFAIVQARLRHVFGLCTGALFFFLRGSKGAVLDPPNVLFFAVPELFRIHWRGAAFLRLSRLGCAMFLAYVLGQKVPLWTRRILLRGFQRCCFGPAEGTVFCCA